MEGPHEYISHHCRADQSLLRACGRSEKNEEYLFFGRESQVDAMVNKLAATRFLAVVGTSGSGKSSLVNCGLRPALHRGLMTRAGTAWRMAQFRPGSAPLRAWPAPWRSRRRLISWL